MRWRLIPAGQNESKKSRNMLCMPLGVGRLHLTVSQGNKIGFTGQPKVPFHGLANLGSLGLSRLGRKFVKKR
jgi:hypothetical protein